MICLVCLRPTLATARACSPPCSLELLRRDRAAHVAALRLGQRLRAEARAAGRPDPTHRIADALAEVRASVEDKIAAGRARVASPNGDPE